MMLTLLSSLNLVLHEAEVVQTFRLDGPKIDANDAMAQSLEAALRESSVLVPSLAIHLHIASVSRKSRQDGRIDHIQLLLPSPYNLCHKFYR